MSEGSLRPWWTHHDLNQELGKQLAQTYSYYSILTSRPYLFDWSCWGQLSLVYLCQFSLDVWFGALHLLSENPCHQLLVRQLAHGTTMERRTSWRLAFSRDRCSEYRICCCEAETAGCRAAVHESSFANSTGSPVFSRLLQHVRTQYTSKIDQSLSHRFQTYQWIQMLYPNAYISF